MILNKFKLPELIFPFPSPDYQKHVIEICQCFIGE